MTVHEIRIPKLGMETIDCEIKSWLVGVGDRVAPGSGLLEVETEKATVVIEADEDGYCAFCPVLPISRESCR